MGPRITRDVASAPRGRRGLSAYFRTAGDEMVLSLWQQRQWPAVERELDRIVTRLRTLDPERVILFGSFARGDFHEGSDIDLMVILNTS
ncbi:MAG: nucleotidyltransferase domain-containing protein, partial [Planctomycetota bacterium]